MNTINSIEQLISKRNHTFTQVELKYVWNKVWNKSGDQSYSDLRILKTIDKIRNLQEMGVNFENKLILDIGCGDGTLIKYLSDIYHCKGVGVDISPKVIASVKNINPDNLTFLQGDHRDLNNIESNTFDIVISLGVIEHFEEYGLALAEARRVLKSGGTLIIIQPHLLSFGVLQEKLLRLLGQWQFGNQYNFSFLYYRKLVRILGFKNIIFKTELPGLNMNVTRHFDNLFKKIYKNWGHYLYLIATK